MQASGVCGLGSKGWANRGSKVRASLSPLCFCSSLLSQLHLLLPAGSPLRLSPTHPPTFLLRQRGDCTLSLSQASKHLLAFRKACLPQSRDEEVSPSGNSRIPAGPGLCVQSEKAQAECIVQVHLAERKPCLAQQGSFGWGRGGSECGGGCAGKHDNQDVATASSENRQQVFRMDRWFLSIHSRSELPECLHSRALNFRDAGSGNLIWGLLMVVVQLCE